ncbi:RNA methyltransferase [Pontibacter saemangeumensis]
MLLNAKKLGYYFRYPLMAVMLLWALTLPGQEVEVYSLLFHGKTADSAVQVVPAPGDGAAVQKQPVQAFQDARVSAYLVLDLPQLAKLPLQLLAFAAPADEPIPAFARSAAGARLCAQLLPGAIQPNAP